jgi:2-dehydro-3-deoxyglucarate aldolase
VNKYESLQHLRRKLNRGEPSVGSWMQLPSSDIAELMGIGGFDWVAVDLEHGHFSPHHLPEIFRSLELNNTLPFARLKDGSPASCKQALDAGAAGVIVPMVENAAQLRQVIAASNWPPAGTRGVGFSRANLFGSSFSKYQVEAQSSFVVAMIETQKALDHLHSIVSVEGLDALLLGPYDLSASIGITAEFNHPEFIEALAMTMKLAKSAHKPIGIHIVDPVPSELQQRIDEGYTFLPYSIDSVFFRNSSINPLNSKPPG